MTENPEPSAEANHPDNCLPVAEHPQEEPIMVELPGDVLAAIQNFTQQSGQTQSETILAVLRAALGLKETQVPALEQAAIDPAPPVPVPIHPALLNTPPPEAQLSAAQWLQEFHDLKNRLAKLEQVLPKLEALEGKLPAF